MTASSRTDTAELIWDGVSKATLLKKMIHRFRSEVWRKTGFKYKYWRERRGQPGTSEFEKLMTFHRRRLFNHFGYILDEQTCEKVLLYSPKVVLREDISVYYRPCYFLKNEHDHDLIRIAVSPFASASDIRAFMSKVSRHIKRRQTGLLENHFGKLQLRTRPKSFAERDRLIANLWNCTVEELQMLADNSPFKRKDVLISTALLMTGEDVSSDHIRKIVANQKKRVNSSLTDKK